MNTVRPLLVGLVAVAALGAAAPAAAECTALLGGLDYELTNRWVEPSTRRTINFKPVCEAHTACYSELGTPRRECDRALEDELTALCEKNFRDGTKARKRCDGRGENALEIVSTKGTSIYLRAQSDARRDARRQAQQSAAANRKANSRQRREQRRREAYKKIYEQLQGGTGTQ